MTTIFRKSLVAAAAAVAALILTGQPSHAGTIEISAPGKAIVAPVERQVLTDSDRIAVRDVIRDQIQAMQSIQAERAFGHVAPAVKARFGSADRFLFMMARFYTPVLKTKQVLFDGLVETGKHPIQRAFVSDDKKRQWLVLFTMERQTDGFWKVRDTALIRAPGHVV